MWFFLAVAGTTDAPTTQAPTTAVSTTEGTVCAGNLFSVSLCQNRINTVPDSCDDPEWYGVCCTFCDDLAASGTMSRHFFTEFTSTMNFLHNDHDVHRHCANSRYYLMEADITVT